MIRRVLLCAVLFSASFGFVACNTSNPVGPSVSGIAPPTRQGITVVTTPPLPEELVTIGDGFSILTEPEHAFTGEHILQWEGYPGTLNVWTAGATDPCKEVDPLQSTIAVLDSVHTCR